MSTRNFKEFIASLAVRRNPKHVHTPDDGRGPRDVFVDGKPVDRVFYADTRRGIVRAFRVPLKQDRWLKRLLTYTVRGKVVVKRKAIIPAASPSPPPTPGSRS